MAVSRKAATAAVLLIAKPSSLKTDYSYTVTFVAVRILSFKLAPVPG